MSDTPFDQKPQTNSGPPLLSCYDDLTASAAYGWSMLARGVKDRKSAFHTPSVATITDTNAPTIRTVVLRGCDTQAKTLRFHTDTRSGKIAELTDNPLGAMHFYDAGAKIQLRLAVRLEALSGPTHQAAYDAAWQATRPMSRECYQVTQGPGSVIDDPYNVDFDAARTRDGADYFIPVAAHILRMEWLYLAARGHRRALFDFENDTQNWLVP
ncbi:MAG: pyridoxamine 5'-phosphate oxidase family protein [Alphaproteobacteria bacterium]|nr:pyridoxamine 5'-phosphate oxidase family protein [Alphaproteobacteria bacterium]